jgi:hypothetical protein
MRLKEARPVDENDVSKKSMIILSKVMLKMHLQNTDW